MQSNLKKLSHTLYECKYHIVFCPEYRHKILKGEIADYCRREFYSQIKQKELVEVLELNVQIDHVHEIWIFKAPIQGELPLKDHITTLWMLIKDGKSYTRKGASGIYSFCRKMVVSLRESNYRKKQGAAMSILWIPEMDSTGKRCGRMIDGRLLHPPGISTGVNGQ